MNFHFTKRIVFLAFSGSVAIANGQNYKSNFVKTVQSTTSNSYFANSDGADGSPDVIAGLTDDNTGEQFSYSKVTKWIDGNTMTDKQVDNVIFRKKGSQYYKLNYSGFLSVKWFGVKGDGSTDETSNLQKAITVAAQLGETIYLPVGTYKITGTISTPQSFSQPIIKGAGARHTRIVFDPVAADQPALKIKGGSGVLSLGRIEDLSFAGNDQSIGIMLADCNGFQVRNCIFETNKTGVLFFNESAKAFTEYCIADYCDFKPTCHTAVEYRRDKGDASFNGSGLMNCTIIQSENETQPKIKIGMGCLPYNAPMSFQVWTKNNTPVIENLGSLVTFHGDITVEPITGVEVSLVNPNGKAVYLTGNVLSNNEKLQLGKLILCDKVALLSKGGIAPMLKPFNKVVSLTAGENAIVPFSVEGSTLQGMSFIITTHITADFYDYTYQLICYQNTYNSDGSVTVLSTPQSMNQANFGEWTFKVKNATLYATNNAIKGKVKAEISVLPMGTRLSYLNSD